MATVVHEARQAGYAKSVSHCAGGLDTELGSGLREQCLAGFRHRDQVLGYKIPVYAIGEFGPEEKKELFWKVVDQSCALY
jgi:hypothetical protein